MLVDTHSLSLLTAISASHLATASPLASSPANAALTPRQMSRPRFGNVPYGVAVTECTTTGKVALSFDDGPGEYTEKVLNTLEKNGDIKATFFLVGTNGANGMANAAYAPLLKRMFNAGHQLASHSWSHKDFSDISHDERVEELVKNEEIFAETLGIVPTYFRPPYTSCDQACLSTLDDLSYHVTDYNLDTNDWVDGGANSKETYSNAVNAGNPESDSFIALAHDIHPFTVNELVQHMIDVAKEKGFEFTTIGECLGDSESNWYRNPETGEPWKESNEEPKPTTTSATPSSTSTSLSTASSKDGSKESKSQIATTTASERHRATETETPQSATTVKPSNATATAIGTSAITPTSPPPTSTGPPIVEANGSGRAAFSILGAVAGVLTCFIMV